MFVAIAVVTAALSAASQARGAALPNPVGIHRLSGNVYEYDYVVRVGNDPYQQIGIHRVVAVHDGVPIVSPDGVFLVHGDVWDFNAAFVGGNSPQQSVAIFLASKGIDVWGIDLGWTLVPARLPSYTFFRTWGLQHNIDDVESGLTFARAARNATGSGGGKLALMTWSRGGWIGYALLNEESQRPAAARQVGAFIPVDTYFKVNMPATQSFLCGAVANLTGLIDSGVYVTGNDGLIQLGRLAAHDPNGPSPFFGPPFDNFQASLEYGAAAFHIGGHLTPWYHYVAGVFPGGSTDNIPTGLAYTDVARWNSFLMSASAVEPLPLFADTFAISCASGPTGPFDDHLNEITVPVFYLAAAGGFGRAGLYSLSLLGSHNVTSHIVSLRPAGQERFDFGHVDLFYARDAAQLAWMPLYTWLIHNWAPPGTP